MKVRGLAEPVLCQRIGMRKVEWGTMDFHLRRRSLLDRAARIEEKAVREKNSQAKDLMRALAALYREMAEELEDSGLFERRFDAVVCADLPRAIDQEAEGQSPRRGEPYAFLPRL